MPPSEGVKLWREIKIDLLSYDDAGGEVSSVLPVALRIRWCPLRIVSTKTTPPDASCCN